jgi:hypothetical protein
VSTAKHLIYRGQSKAIVAGQVQGWLGSSRNESDQQTQHLASRLSTRVEFYPSFTLPVPRIAQTPELITCPCFLANLDKTKRVKND